MVELGKRKKAKKSPVTARKAAKKHAAAPKSKAMDIQSLERKASELAMALGETRKQIFENERVLREKIAEKIKLDDELNSILKQCFENEKSLLARIKGGAQRKEASLREQLASLERVSKIYDSKKARMLEDRKREAALRKQLSSLERKAEELGVYA